MSFKWLFSLIVIFLVACLETEKRYSDDDEDDTVREGTRQGDCYDGYDNDDDGFVDCYDSGCADKDVCAGFDSDEDGSEYNWTCELTITGTEPETEINEILANSEYTFYCTIASENDEYMQENCDSFVGSYESQGYTDVICDWNCYEEEICEEGRNSETD